MKLRWKDLPPDGLHLSDARQALVSHRAEGSQHEAVVRIARPEPSAPPAVDVLPRNDREALLGKTRFIDPADPDIVSKAAEWTKDAKTQLDTVTALAENVFQHLRGGELIAETLSGPEVLKCRKGKCSEYAVLFASLARARNIPTRIVLGDRMVGGSGSGTCGTRLSLKRVRRFMGRSSEPVAGPQSMRPRGDWLCSRLAQVHSRRIRGWNTVREMGSDRLVGAVHHQLQAET